MPKKYKTGTTVRIPPAPPTVEYEGIKYPVDPSLTDIINSGKYKVRVLKVKGKDRICLVWKTPDGKRRTRLLDKKRGALYPDPEKAIEKYKKRKKLNRYRDEIYKGKVVREYITARWVKDPSVYDIRGIDDRITTTKEYAESLKKRVRNRNKKDVGLAPYFKARLSDEEKRDLIEFKEALNRGEYGEAIKKAEDFIDDDERAPHVSLIAANYLAEFLGRHKDDLKEETFNNLGGIAVRLMDNAVWDDRYNGLLFGGFPGKNETSFWDNPSRMFYIGIGADADNPSNKDVKRAAMSVLLMDTFEKLRRIDADNGKYLDNIFADKEVLRDLMDMNLIPSIDKNIYRLWEVPLIMLPMSVGLPPMPHTIAENNKIEIIVGSTESGGRRIPSKYGRKNPEAYSLIGRKFKDNTEHLMNMAVFPPDPSTLNLMIKFKGGYKDYNAIVGSDPSFKSLFSYDRDEKIWMLKKDPSSMDENEKKLLNKVILSITEKAGLKESKKEIEKKVNKYLEGLGKISPFPGMLIKRLFGKGKDKETFILTVPPDSSVDIGASAVSITLDREGLPVKNNIELTYINPFDGKKRNLAISDPIGRIYFRTPGAALYVFGTDGKKTLKRIGLPPSSVDLPVSAVMVRSYKKVKIPKVLEREIKKEGVTVLAPDPKEAIKTVRNIFGNGKEKIRIYGDIEFDDIPKEHKGKIEITDEPSESDAIILIDDIKKGNKETLLTEIIRSRNAIKGVRRAKNIEMPLWKEDGVIHSVHRIIHSVHSGDNLSDIVEFAGEYAGKPNAVFGKGGPNKGYLGKVMKAILGRPLIVTEPEDLDDRPIDEAVGAVAPFSVGVFALTDLESKAGKMDKREVMKNLKKVFGPKIFGKPREP